MKSITYISKVVGKNSYTHLPPDLTKIFFSAQRNNSKLGITGIISFISGHYVQVIEGDDEAIDRLFSKIREDPRHDNVTTLLNIPITQRSFAETGMKLSKSLIKDDDFQAFVNKYSNTIKRIPQSKQALLKKLSPQHATHTDSPDHLKGKYIRLASWPDVTAIGQSPELLSLCAKLVNGPNSYDELISSGEFASTPNIIDILTRFDEDKLLIVTSTSQVMKSNATQDSGSSFYSKMKNFLNW